MDNNGLVWLPFRISHLSKLRFLSAAHNQLALLPGDFRKLTLENLDLFGNPFAHPNPLDHTIQLTFPLTLQEMAARAVANLRLVQLFLSTFHPFKCFYLVWNYKCVVSHKVLCNI